MDGYDASTYGERFVDVYDHWYGEITDTAACVATLAELAATAGGGPVLELGVGTGRLAIPLAERGLAVTGLDASPAMLAALAAKPGGERVTAVLGDMTEPTATVARPQPSGGGADPRVAVDGSGFALAFVAYNTLFNLVADGAQQRCLTATASLLAPDGHLVVEAFVPDPDRAGVAEVTPRRVTADRVVLSVSTSSSETQEVMGQFVDITEAGIKLRPWHIRWTTPDQLDVLAADAGLVLAHRWATWTRQPFTAEDPSHVSVYRPV